MLTDKSIRYTIRQIKGRGTKVVAEDLKVTQRHIQRLYIEYVKTEKIHTRPCRSSKETCAQIRRLK